MMILAFGCGLKKSLAALTFGGLSHAELVSTRVELTSDGRKQYRWIQSRWAKLSSGSLAVGTQWG
jgi:hypothetical protein